MKWWLSLVSSCLMIRYKEIFYGFYVQCCRFIMIRASLLQAKMQPKPVHSPSWRMQGPKG
ncbi:hypothetical protein Hanom_Chr00s016322g01756041 [Helianthus anomalus]